MHVKIHTKGIKGSRVAKEGETPAVMFGVVLEIDGCLLEQAFDVGLSFAEEFVTLTAKMHPSSVEIVSHTEESWPGMEEAIEKARTARTGMGLALGRN